MIRHKGNVRAFNPADSRAVQIFMVVQRNRLASSIQETDGGLTVFRCRLISARSSSVSGPASSRWRGHADFPDVVTAPPPRPGTGFPVFHFMVPPGSPTASGCCGRQVDVLKVEQLVECADHGIAEYQVLLLEFLHPEEQSWHFQRSVCAHRHAGFVLSSGQ
jgi:hypothetical protein